MEVLVITERLARFACETDQFPGDVLAAAKVAMMDTLGCALAGYDEPAARIAREQVADFGGRPVAAVWGTTLRTSPADAAFANAIATHVLDFDDTLSTLRGHPSATTLPVALAVGEQAGASGSRILQAYAIGIELAGKLGLIFGDGHYIKGWHNTATVGVFAATAVAARLMGADAATLRRAWGIAASECAGVLRNFGTMSKSFQAGHAARAGIVAADLARRGFTASDSIFDGPRGFQHLYGSDVEDAASVVARLGEPWDLVDPGNNYKRWPCCYCSHRALGGILQLMEAHGIAPAQITRIRIGFPPGSDEPLAYDDPQSGLEGKFSAQYPVAALMLDGSLNLQSFTDAMVKRPAVADWIAKIERYRVQDARVYSGTVGYTDVEIRTPTGLFARRVLLGPGSRSWPIPEDEHQDKFRSCAKIVLGDAQSEELLRVILGFDREQGASRLVVATVPRVSGSARS